MVKKNDIYIATACPHYKDQAYTELSAFFPAYGNAILLLRRGCFPCRRQQNHIHEPVWGEKGEKRANMKNDVNLQIPMYVHKISATSQRGRERIAHTKAGIVIGTKAWSIVHISLQCRAKHQTARA